MLELIIGGINLLEIYVEVTNINIIWGGHKMLKAFMKSKKGFTLVELMVVVVIIGILTAIAVPVYNSVTVKAERSAIEANLRTIDGLIMTATATEAVADVDTAAEIETKLKSDYLPNWPDVTGEVTYNVIQDATTGQFLAQVTGTAKGGLTAGSKYTLNTLP